MNLPIILLNAAQEAQRTGLWASFVNFLSSILQGLNKITGAIPEPFGGYGLAIVLFTILMRLVLLPLDIKARKANYKIQQIQPELSEIQKKYKNNPEKLNKKTMELYQKYQINPFGGCLPLLIQMPLFFALFAALRSIAENPAIASIPASFLWIKNIWLPDSPLINMVGEKIAPFSAGFNGLYLLAILAGVTSYYQISLSQPKNAANDQMKSFGIIMPLMSVWFCIQYTASFAIYWVTSNVFQIVQQFIMRKYLAPESKEGENE